MEAPPSAADPAAAVRPATPPSLLQSLADSIATCVGGPSGEQLRELQEVVTHLQDALEKAEVHNALLQEETVRRKIEARLRANGIPFRSDIRDFGAWKYIMCPAPDGVLLELFQADPDKLDGDAAKYFSDWLGD